MAEVAFLFSFGTFCLPCNEFCKVPNQVLLPAEETIRMRLFPDEDKYKYSFLRD